jgi:arginine exporter protein ArgO
MTAAFLAGVVAGYGVAVPVGAIGVLIIGLTARTSLAVGVAAALGVATADGLYALVAVLGGAALAAAIEPVAGPLRWVAAAVLLALAGHTAVGAIRHHRDPSVAAREPGGLNGPRRAYFGLVALTALNPATVVYFAALVIGRRFTGGPGGAAAFVLGAFLASASWQLVLAGGGSLVGRVLAGSRARLASALVSSVIVAALAAYVLIS